MATTFQETKPLHLFQSAYENQRFQPGCSTETVQFFNHEAVVENEAVAVELDKLIAKGAIPHIKRIMVEDVAKEAARQEANYKAAIAKLAAVSNGAGNVGMTTTINLGATAADSLANVGAASQATGQKKV